MDSREKANVYVHTPEGPKRLIRFSEDMDDGTVLLRVFSGLNFNNPRLKICEHRFSVHTSKVSATHNMIKRHIRLDGEKKSRTLVCMTDAIKAGSGFTSIIFTKFTDLRTTISDFDTHHYQDICLGKIDPNEQVLMVAVFVGHKDSIFPEIKDEGGVDQPYVERFSLQQYQISDFNFVIINILYNYPSTPLGNFHERSTLDPRLFDDNDMKAFHRERMKAFSVQECLDYFSHSAIWYLREHLIAWAEHTPDDDLKEFLLEQAESIEVGTPPHLF